MKILLVVNKKVTALQYFRQDMPHAAMMDQYPITFGKVTSDEEGLPDIMGLDEKEIDKYDAISYLRQITYDSLINEATVNFLHSKGKKVFFDIDDWWRVPRSHSLFEPYKESNFAKIIEHTLSLVDLVTCTNEVLADKIRPFNANVEVLPNFINPAEPQFRRRTIESSLLRFGWVGGLHHLPDFEIMREGLKKAHSLPIQLCLGGFNLSHEPKKLPVYFEMERIMTDNHRSVMEDRAYCEYLMHGTPAMEHVSYNKPYRRLWARPINDYADMYNQFDVALVPLGDNNFNNCKSELKLLEAGVMGKAVIASDVYPYNEVIEHGVNGLLCRSPIDWFVMIKRLYENRDLVKLYAENLTKTINEKFDVDKINEKRFAVYKKNLSLPS